MRLNTEHFSGLALVVLFLVTMHRRHHSKNLFWRDDDNGGNRRFQSKNITAMMNAYGPEEELPAKNFDDEEISNLVRQFIKIGDETDKEAILIALKVFTTPLSVSIHQTYERWCQSIACLLLLVCFKS